jgi:Holin of 3TMs, for gene-transfer release
VSEQQKSYADMSEAEKKKEDWMNSKWRPMMGWMYMLVCMSDFILFPILWSAIQAVGGGQVHTQWQPITLQGAGLFHIAMGAVLGIAAFGRTQEKLGGANNGGLNMPSHGNSGFGASTGGFNSPASMGGFNSQSQMGGFNSPAPMVPRSTTVTTTSTFGASASPMISRTGKPMPIQPDEPEL